MTEQEKQKMLEQFEKIDICDCCHDYYSIFQPYWNIYANGLYCNKCQSSDV